MRANKNNKKRTVIWLLSAASALVIILLLRQSGSNIPYINYRRSAGAKTAPNPTPPPAQDYSSLEKIVVPQEGYQLLVRWGSIGQKLVRYGVIDEGKFSQIYADRGGLGEEGTALLEKDSTNGIKITAANSSVLLNIFWALGLANQNEILDKGPMQSPLYEGAGNFASTGGWTLAKGDAMEHYSKHNLVVLNAAQQSLVQGVADNIYRPCCDNPTSFPDCNHGMAMLGLVELMASEGLSEAEIYEAALKVNSYWFPSTYITIAGYMESKGTKWQDVSPREVLGEKYSSASGYRKIASEVTPAQIKGGGGCSV